MTEYSVIIKFLLGSLRVKPQLYRNVSGATHVCGGIVFRRPAAAIYHVVVLLGLRNLSIIRFCKPKLLICVRLHVDLYYFEEPSCAQYTRQTVKGRFSTYLLLTPLYDLRPSTAASISGEQRVLVFSGLC